MDAFPFPCEDNKLLGGFYIYEITHVFRDSHNNYGLGQKRCQVFFGGLARSPETTFFNIRIFALVFYRQ